MKLSKPDWPHWAACQGFGGMAHPQRRQVGAAGQLAGQPSGGLILLKQVCPLDWAAGRAAGWAAGWVAKRPTSQPASQPVGWASVFSYRWMGDVSHQDKKEMVSSLAPRALL